MAKPNHIAFDLLTRAQGDLAASIFTENVLHKPLVLRPTTDEDQPTDARQARQRARDARKAAAERRNRKPRPLTAREKRDLGLHRIPEEQRKWEIFEPLHRMWLGYIHEVLGLKSRDPKAVFVDAKGAGPLLAAADMHGAVLTVVRCRCIGRVGVTGIVAKETKGAFEMITRRDELKIIPKEYTIFELKIPLHMDGEPTDASPAFGDPECLVFEIHGSQFAHRPADRITKKLKFHFPKDT